MLKNLALLMIGSYFIGVSAFAQQQKVTCKISDVCRVATTHLPLRGLPRPFTRLYAKADANGAVLADNIRSFWPVYIFQRKAIDFSDPTHPKGWYQVGTHIKDPVGWVQAKDLVEWKQSLIVSYMHPGIGEDKRQPVLMFSSQDRLRELVESDARESRAKTIYKNLTQAVANVPDYIVSREPTRFVSIKEKFYLLPIIDFEAVDLFEDDTLLLRVVAAVPGSRADEENPDTIRNKQFMQQVLMDDVSAGTEVKTLGFDIKFVIDMTSSMGPHIKSTKKAIRKVVTEVAKNNANANIKYGLVGYRDDVSMMPDLGFTVKNFTPTLVTGKAFDRVIANAKHSAVASADYQEEVFPGILEGITSDWSDNSIKIIILVGDASSHPVGHKQNTLKMGENELRALAHSKQINIISLHLKAKRATVDHPLAMQQYATLASNTGSGEASYLSVDAKDKAQYERAVHSIASELSAIIAKLSQGDVGIINTVNKTPDTATIEEKAKTIAQSIAANALIEYLGKTANPPRDLTTWVMDRDLIDPAIPSLEVSVLIKKGDLNNLIGALENILKAVKRSKLTSQGFFQSLQGVVTQVNVGSGDVKISFDNAKRLAESGLLPHWISSLPYTSTLLDMDDEYFAALSAEERSGLEYEIEAKLQLYQELNENSDLWVELDKRDATIDHVYPIPLTALP